METAGKYKSIQLATTTFPGYLRFDISGPYDFADYQKVVTAMRDACKVQGKSHALIDLLGIVGDIPQFERYILGKLWAEVWGGALKAAVIAPMDRVNRFFENTAVNRQARVQVFFEEQPALEWLLEP